VQRGRLWLRGDGGWFDGKQRLGWRAEGSGRGGCFMSVLLAQNYPCAARPVRACFHGRVRSTPTTVHCTQYSVFPTAAVALAMPHAPGSVGCMCVHPYCVDSYSQETNEDDDSLPCRSRRSLASKHFATSARGLAWQPASLQWVGQQMTQPARRRPRRICVNAPRQTNHRRTRILIPRA
jgi:hypothetical protein